LVALRLTRPPAGDFARRSRGSSGSSRRAAPDACSFAVSVARASL